MIDKNYYFETELTDSKTHIATHVIIVYRNVRHGTENAGILLCRPQISYYGSEELFSSIDTNDFDTFVNLCNQCVALYWENKKTEE